ncbi:monovalent cation:proton antiporter family protein [Accumulibacter sp.]|uniref:monovalent cation:proton antiporter family protein n=1 Tax=Accumulibacter sp. TaxID=2053492 RepID=UPI0026091679|nr:monovalent cation:proton antiporter family protein [Accumulibacter sp.]
MEHTVALQLVIVLAVGTAFVALCQRFRLSPIIGYLTTGVLVGPTGAGWLPDGPTTRLLAELGVVLLMFTVGLEFSLPRLLGAKRLVLGLGGAQLVVTASLFALPGMALGLTPTQALLIGVALAMSSTAIVLKQLGEQMELPAPHGRLATGILLFQDIAAVPVLAVMPILVTEPMQLGGALALALGKAGLVFLGLVLVGRWALPPLLHWVASTRSLELFMLTALLMVVAAAGLSTIAGLSPTLGAFMAGMLLGETLFRHQIEADIRPFRDLMLGLFFASIGMQVNPEVFGAQPGAVALTLFALVIAKPLILALLVRVMGHVSIDSWRSAISLAQGGEFGLLVVATAVGLGVINTQIAQPLLAGIILSMLVAPVMLRFNQPLTVKLFSRGRGDEALPTEAYIAEASRDFDQHVIICGYGRHGQNLLRMLANEGVAATALDLDPERVRQAAAAGEPVIYGNAVQPGVLRAAGVERACALAITLSDATVAERIVGHVRGLGLELPILALSTHGRHDEALVAAGAKVFPEGLESSLAFAGQMLVMLNIAPSQVEARLNEIRAQDYAPLRAFFHTAEGEKSAAQALDFPEQIRSILLTEGHYATGRTAQELRLWQLGVELVDLRRGAIRVQGRLLDTRLRVGDVLVLKGKNKTIERAIARLTEGG